MAAAQYDILAAGTAAPNFTLRATHYQNLTLSDLKARPVILAYYPADWSPVCVQMTLYSRYCRSFRKHDAEMLGISVDGVWCHAAFARDCRLHFPLLSDFEPKGEVSQGGTLPIARVKVSPSVAFVLDRQGVIA